MIRIQNVSKSYDGGSTYAVEKIDLHVKKGELLVLLGESGCGKTTTLKMINRLIDLSDGSIEVQGENTSLVDPVILRRRIGYVFQSVGLFPHMTVSENISITPTLLGWRPDDVTKRVEELLTLIHLPPAEFEAKCARAVSEGTAGEGRGFVLMPSACPYGRHLPDQTLRNYELIIKIIEEL